MSGEGPPILHELEALVMHEVWRHEETTVREVLEAVNADVDRARAYTTIMTIMTRLTAKGLLTRRRQGKTDWYTARLSRDEYREARADAAVGALVDEYGDAALVHFARQMEQLDPERRRRLRRLARGD